MQEHLTMSKVRVADWSQDTKKVEIYRLEREVEILQSPELVRRCIAGILY